MPSIVCFRSFAASANSKEPLKPRGRYGAWWERCSCFGQSHVAKREGKALRQCAPIEFRCVLEFRSHRSDMKLTTAYAPPP